MTEADRYGEFVTGNLPKHAMCCMVTALDDGTPVACAYAAGHRSLHSWHAVSDGGSRRPVGRGVGGTGQPRVRR